MQRQLQLTTFSTRLARNSFPYKGLTMAGGGVSLAPRVTSALVARDVFDNQLVGGGLTVLFGLAGGTSDGTFTAVSDNGHGTYQADFQGVTAGSPATVTATIVGAP